MSMSSLSNWDSKDYHFPMAHTLDLGIVKYINHLMARRAHVSNAFDCTRISIEMYLTCNFSSENEMGKLFIAEAVKCDASYTKFIV